MRFRDQKDDTPTILKKCSGLSLQVTGIEKISYESVILMMDFSAVIPKARPDSLSTRAFPFKVILFLPD